MSEDRRLAAIMFTDIVGYTAMMGSDESKAFQLLRKNRNIQKSLFKKYNGKWLKEMGDGILASFNNSTDAVRCAGEIQYAAKKEGIGLRIGIHEGEVVFEGRDVLGDGVNVASRLEVLAQEGSIYISGSVYRDIKNKEGIKTEFIEEMELKNVDEPVKVYKVQCEVNVKVLETLPEKSSNKRAYYITGVLIGMIVAIALIWLLYPRQQGFVEEGELEKSIAVLPFKNLSPEKENQYLTDGVMDAITNHLAKIKELRVIARTSTEVYRDRPEDIREIGKEIGVNYLLEGSFQKYANNGRLIIQLINAKDGSHLWSNEYDKEWSDIFKVQSEVAIAIATEIKVVLTPEEKHIIDFAPTSNLTAYDYYLRGQDYLYRSYSEEDFQFAFHMYEKAIELDSSFTLAWVGLAASSRLIYWFYYDRSDEHLQSIKHYLDKAIELSSTMLEVELEETKYYYQCKREYQNALEKLQKLNSEYPLNADIYFWMGIVYRRMLNFSKAIDMHNHAIKLNPAYWLYWNEAAHLLTFTRDYNKAVEYKKRAIALNPSWRGMYKYLIYLYYLEGDMNKLDRFLKSDQTPLDSQMIQIQIALMDNNYEKAIELYESIPDYIENDQFNYFSKHFRLGELYYLISDENKVKVHFEAERKFLEAKLEYSKNDDRVSRSLGIVYAGLGNRTKAIEFGTKAIELRGMKNDPFNTDSELAMIRILLMVGNYNEGIERLESLLNYTGNISVEYLKYYYIWKPFQNIKGFQELISNPENQINQ